MRDTRLAQELKTYLKFVFEQEYKMLLSYYPNSKLLIDEDLRQE
jgi:23S rRNA A2030 N6-methylase RlmJ